MLGGPLSVVAVGFRILVPIPVLETVRLDLLQKMMLPVLHLVRMLPVTNEQSQSHTPCIRMKRQILQYNMMETKSELQQKRRMDLDLFSC